MFGIATSFAYIVTHRRPRMEHKWLVWVASLAIATPMPFLRVDAGSHFWTDTLTGTVLGIGMGLVVPYMHEKKPKLGDVAIRPYAGSGSFGLAGSW